VEKSHLQLEAEFIDFFKGVKQERQAESDALATVRRFNTSMSSGRHVWFWPKIAAGGKVASGGDRPR